MAGQVVVSAVAGAGFQIIFDNLLQGFLTALKNNSQFKPSLKRLEGMLEDMAPIIKKIEESINAELYQPKQLERLKGLMKEGNDLVIKCSKIHKYSFWEKPLYNLKLLKLVKDIRDHISTVLQLQEVGDTRDVSSGVRQLSDQIGRLTVDSISNNTAATSQDQQQQQQHRSSSSSITASPDQIFPTATTLQNGNSS